MKIDEGGWYLRLLLEAFINECMVISIVLIGIYLILLNC